MDDEKMPQNENEFQFTEAEEAPDVYEDKTSTSRKFDKINRRNILIAIIIIVVALSVYKLVGIFLGTTTKTKTTPTTRTTLESAVTPIPATAETQQPIIQQQVQQPSVSTEAPTQPTAALSQQLSEVQAHAVDNKQQINTIKNNLSQLSNSVSNVQDTLDSMGQQLQSISSQLTQQRSAIQALKPKKPKRITKRAIPPRTVYYIQAIMPGRAWLVKPDGTSITVNVGDRLAGYGKITAIAPTQGVVKTSAGVVIGYRDH